jgi:hypothetical protein
VSGPSDRNEVRATGWDIAVSAAWYDAFITLNTAEPGWQPDEVPDAHALYITEVCWRFAEASVTWFQDGGLIAEVADGANHAAGAWGTLLASPNIEYTFT